jgi:hypothetical protein
MATVEMKRAIAGYYTGTLRGMEAGKSPINAVVKCERDGWAAKFVNCDSGNVVRFAGVWKTYREAREEIEHIARREFF